MHIGLNLIARGIHISQCTGAPDSINLVSHEKIENSKSDDISHRLESIHTAVERKINSEVRSVGIKIHHDIGSIESLLNHGAPLGAIILTLRKKNVFTFLQKENYWVTKPMDYQRAPIF